jgi:hypothetical protein
MFTRLRKMWKVCENFVELLGGLFGVWKEKFGLTHKIDKVRYLLYDEVVCIVDGILSELLYHTRMEQNQLFLVFSLDYIMWHTLVSYIPYPSLL